MTKRKSLRRTQTVTPFGVGSVLDIMGESLVAADASCWRGRLEEVREPRLERKLGVAHFCLAPEAPDDPADRATAIGVPFYRFPQAHFCRSCRRMYETNVSQETGLAPICPRCGRRTPLTPMRFVMACACGHLADVPWHAWAHQDRQGVCAVYDLYFETVPGGSGLEYVVVRCNACGARHSLEGIASRDSLRRLNIRCTGRQPWQRPSRSDRCDAIPQVLQRGATNLTFPVIESSIDIPPDSRYNVYGSDWNSVISSPYYRALAGAIHNRNQDMIAGLCDLLAGETGLDPTFVRRIAEREARLEGETVVQGAPADDDLLGPEYEALLNPDPEDDHHPQNRFVRREVPLQPYLDGLPVDPARNAERALAHSIAHVVQVTRLREVRALRGFTRLGPLAELSTEEDPPGSFDTYGGGRITPMLVPADLDRLPATNRWLPAVEVYGEGVFLSLNEAALRRWETRPDVVERIEALAYRRSRSAWYLPPATPRLVLLHTLSHLLIRQLSFECGYSIASLRERLYVRSPEEEGPAMAGILIYTAAGDSEGTMGGLVREGDPDRLLPALVRALLDAGWCSSDPVCRESRGQGPGSLNLAACHACSLLPETSCILSNRFLDRMLVIDSIENTDRGFFSELVQFTPALPV